MNFIRAAILASLAALALSVPAQASQTVVSGATAKDLAGLFAADGVKAADIKVNADEPHFFAKWPGHHGSFEVRLHDCKMIDGSKECGFFVFGTWWTPKKPVPLAKLNKFNKDWPLGKVYMLTKDGPGLKKGTVILSYTVTLDAGVTEDHIAASLSDWDSTVKAFREMFHP